MINYDYIQEAYFGKPKLCLEMEKCIGQVRGILKTKSIQAVKGSDETTKWAARALDAAFTPEIFARIEGTEPWKHLTHLIEKQFGFYSVSLLLDGGVTPNARTYTVCGTVDYGVLSGIISKVSKNGYHYDPKWGVSTVIFVGLPLFLDYRFSSGEIMAVIMHEIGHNFQTSLSPVLCGLTLIKNIIDINTELFKIEDPEQKVLRGYAMFGSVKIISNKILKSKYGPSIMLIKNLVEFIVKGFSDNLNAILSLPYGIVMNITRKYDLIKTWVKVFKNLSKYTTSEKLDIVKSLFNIGKRYTDEVAADSFASMHGYGPELITALKKVETLNVAGVGEVINHTPLLGHIFGCLISAFRELAIFDPHPNTAARLNICLSVIEDDLEDKRLSPKLRLQLKKDIKELRKNIEQYDYKIENDYSGKAGGLLVKFWSTVLPGFGELRSIASKIAINSKYINFMTDLKRED